MRTPHTPRPENATACKVWIQNDLLEWIDNEAEKRERSRAFMVNEACRQRMDRLEKQRKPRRGDDGNERGERA